MSDDMTAVPGWLPDAEGPAYAPNASDHWITRAALVKWSTLTDAQVTTLVRDGRLTAHRAPANKRLQVFRLSEVEALFQPVPESDLAGGEA